MYIETHFSVPSPPQSRSQAVVCVSTSRMYPRSGYFLVYIYFISVSDKVALLAIKNRLLKLNLLYLGISQKRKSPVQGAAKMWLRLPITIQHYLVTMA